MLEKNNLYATQRCVNKVKVAWQVNFFCKTPHHDSDQANGHTWPRWSLSFIPNALGQSAVPHLLRFNLTVYSQLASLESGTQSKEARGGGGGGMGVGSEEQQTYSHETCLQEKTRFLPLQKGFYRLGCMRPLAHKWQREAGAEKPVRKSSWTQPHSILSLEC